MKFRAVHLVFIAVLAFGCSTVEMESVADVSLSGMACEMMCGGSIKKAMAETEGVLSTEIEFDAEQEVDHAFITFNEAKVTKEELVAKLSALNDGQFEIKGVTVEKVAKEIPAPKEEEEEESNEVSMIRSLPNIFDSFVRIF